MLLLLLLLLPLLHLPSLRSVYGMIIKGIFVHREAPARAINVVTKRQVPVKRMRVGDVDSMCGLHRRSSILTKRETTCR